MNQEVANAICSIDEEIAELNKRKELLQKIDLTKPIDEDLWHELCETELRYSDVLCDIIRIIFPNAENINRSCNYVFFEIKNFKISIPISRCRGINVDTSWYQYSKKPKYIYYPDTIEYDMKKYFELKNSGGSWQEMVKLRIHNTYHRYKQWYLAVLWFGKYKWKDDNQQYWEEKFKSIEKKYYEKVKKVDKENSTIKEKRRVFLKEIIPEIEKFSTKHYKYEDSMNISYQPSIEEIIKDENEKEMQN